MPHIPLSPLAPSPWISRFAPLVAAGGPVLDLACGGGRHLRLFRALGHPVTGVDIDLSGVADLEETPGVTLRGLDLEGGGHKGAPAPGLAAALGGPYAAVVVCNYLHRPLLPLLRGLLAPDGLLLYETFAQGHQRLGRPHRAAFLLRPGELLELAAHSGLTVIAYETGLLADHPAVVQRLAAWRPDGTAPDLAGAPEPRPLP